MNKVSKIIIPPENGGVIFLLTKNFNKSQIFFLSLNNENLEKI